MKKVIIGGGGLAGISAAVHLAENGFDVTIMEATPKLGGRAFSFYENDTKEILDNGQHIFAGWYTNTFELLKILDKKAKFKSSDCLEVYFKDDKSNTYHFHAVGDNPIIAIAKGFANYKPLTINDKLKLLNLKELIEYDISERLLKGKTLDWLLDYLKQTENLKKYFWFPFTYAVFNTSPEFVDAVIFYNVLVSALKNPYSLSLVIPEEPLDNIFIEPFIKYAEKKNIKILYNTKIINYTITGNEIDALIATDNNVYYADYYVSAVPFYNFKKLFPENSFGNYFADFKELKQSSITSIYLFPDKMPEALLDSYYYGMIGLLNTSAQWVFFKKNYISVTISSPENLIVKFKEMNNQNIIDKVIEELKNIFPELKDTNFIYTKYLNEKRATFLPFGNTNSNRLPNKTKIHNLFLAGDWTDTGLPSTIESAVKSGKKCMQFIRKSIE